MQVILNDKNGYPLVILKNGRYQVIEGHHLLAARNEVCSRGDGISKYFGGGKQRWKRNYMTFR